MAKVRRQDPINQLKQLSTIDLMLVQKELNLELGRRSVGNQ